MKNSIAGLVALLLKVGPKLASMAVKFLKAAKVGKVGLASASVASYAFLFTWEFAIMIMILLIVHESGHVWAMKRCGMKTKGIYFIPFMGAAAVADEEFKSCGDEVYIAIMGPIWGFALSIAVAAVYFITNNALFAAAAGWMAMVNLFNLLPINPLDGGRIMKSISLSIDSRLGFAFLIFGVIALIFITFYLKIFLFFILLIIGTLELFFIRKYGGPAPMGKKEIIISAIAYIAVVAILWTLMSSMNSIPEVAIAREIFMG